MERKKRLAHDLRAYLRLCKLIRDYNVNGRRALAYVLQRDHDLSTLRIAEELGTTPGSVRTILHRAKLQIEAGEDDN